VASTLPLCKTEFQELLYRLPQLSTADNTKTEGLHYRALPTPLLLNHDALVTVTKERTASPLEFTREFQEFWTAHPRDGVFGNHSDALSTQFTGFSICHSMYGDKQMLKGVQHATASALNNQEATSTFLLLPNWMGNSTSAFHKTCTDNKDVCTLLGNVPEENVRYMPLL
jgi:hypothetical protein